MTHYETPCVIHITRQGQILAVGMARKVYGSGEFGDADTAELTAIRLDEVFVEAPALQRIAGRWVAPSELTEVSDV